MKIKDKTTGLKRDVTTSCRSCNACVAANKNTWTARCMAEMASAGNALVITLTYAPLPNGQEPIGARVFRNKDLTKFLDMLRSMYKHKYNKTGEISFLAAGEQGSNGTQRIHWHVIIFSNQSLGPLGRWFLTRDDFDNREISRVFDEPFELMPKGKKTRCWTNLWPHGHVNLMEPTQEGMAYVTKYILKDKFNAVRARNTMRQAQSENHTSSKFRLSRNPPLGTRYLQSKIDLWSKEERVPPNLNIQIPNYTGYWYPARGQRELLITQLWEINERHKYKHGRDCSQWESLKLSLQDFQREATDQHTQKKDWEIANNGPQHSPENIKKQKVTDFIDAASNARDKLSFQRDIAEKQEARDLYALYDKCHHFFPCKKCVKSLSDDEYSEAHREFSDASEAYRLSAQIWNPRKGEYYVPHSTPSFGDYWRSKCRINVRCKNRREQWLKNWSQKDFAVRNLTKTKQGSTPEQIDERREEKNNEVPNSRPSKLTRR